MTQDRRRDAHTDPPSTGVRWFKLYEAISANGGHAQAYRTRWNTTTGQWEATTTSTKTTIYNGPNGAAASADDYLQCIYMPQSRHWEVIEKGSSAEQSRFWHCDSQTGISTSAISYGLIDSAGEIDGTTVTALGTNPSGFTRKMKATTAQNIWFIFSGYFNKETAGAGVASVVVQVKRWNNADALQETWNGFCDIPTLSATTAGMSLAFQGKVVMAVNDYITCEVYFTGAYASTLASNNSSLYLRPIRT